MVSPQGSRQLTESQRGLIGAKLLPHFEKAAKERQRASGGDHKHKAVPVNLPEPKSTVRDQVGKRHYGDGLYKRAAEITGFSAQALMDFSSIAGRFEFSWRHENLSYQHHKEVASIKQIATDKDGKLFLSDEPDQEKIAELLAEAEKRAWRFLLM